MISFINLMLKIKKIFFGSNARGFVSAYLIFMIIGASLLKLPISLQAGVTLAWTDALFVSASAISTTGLSTIVVKDTFTVFGQTVLIFLIQFGGIGLIMMVSLFWLIVRKHIGFKDRTMMMTDQNQLSRQGIVRFIRSVLIMIFTIEIVAFMIMSHYLFFAGYFNYKQSLFQGLFLTVSLFVNAGFDISPTGDSLIMFHQDYFMQSLGMLLMLLGAIGFWPLYELKEWIVSKVKKEKFEFSIFSKVLVFMHLGFWLFGAILLYSLEYTHFLADKQIIESIYYVLFTSLTTRNAGFTTSVITDYSASSHLVMMALMFIGSSPNSAGGGIRTTTILLVILGIRAFALGKQQVVIKQRSIKHETVFKSFIVIFVASTLISFFTILLSISEPFEVMKIVFELISAFGTTGLSLGITPNLSTFGKIIIVITMFIGRVGIVALLLMFKPSSGFHKNGVSYPEMDMIVG